MRGDVRSRWISIIDTMLAGYGCQRRVVAEGCRKRQQLHTRREVLVMSETSAGKNGRRAACATLTCVGLVAAWRCCGARDDPCQRRLGGELTRAWLNFLCIDVVDLDAPLLQHH